MKKGFTLIELIVVITLFLMLASVVLWVFVVGLKSWDSGKNRANIRQSVNAAFERMTRELSQASEIAIAKADEIEFEADLDQNGSAEAIKFDISNAGVLQRTEIIVGPDIIVSMVPYVQSFTLGYYLDSDNDDLLSTVTTPSDLDSIRVVVMSITVTAGDETLTFSTSAYVRNQSDD